MVENLEIIHSSFKLWQMPGRRIQGISLECNRRPSYGQTSGCLCKVLRLNVTQTR